METGIAVRYPRSDGCDQPEIAGWKWLRPATECRKSVDHCSRELPTVNGRNHDRLQESQILWLFIDKDVRSPADVYLLQFFRRLFLVTQFKATLPIRRWMNGFPSQSDTAIVRWGVSEELVPADIYQALATAGGLRKGRTDAFERPPVPSVADSIIEQMLPHLPPIIADTDLLTGDGTTKKKPKKTSVFLGFLRWR